MDNDLKAKIIEWAEENEFEDYEEMLDLLWPVIQSADEWYNACAGQYDVGREQRIKHRDTLEDLRLKLERKLDEK